MGFKDKEIIGERQLSPNHELKYKAKKIFNVFI
jgi:hypothetical protein